VSRAETALKQAKENKYENYFALTKTDKADTGRSLALKADLKRALAQNELELYYQPKVNLATLEVIGAECLLRWNHPLDGVLFPGPLIEAAESYNMMNELGYWTLEQAFRALVELNALKMPIVLSVNISPTQLYDNQLVPTLTMLSETYAMPVAAGEVWRTARRSLATLLDFSGSIYLLFSTPIDLLNASLGSPFSYCLFHLHCDCAVANIDDNVVLAL
jgi:EAL domain-containing protein (putative c-di-GMP-specific phosphodiesterase class I)